MTTDDELLTRSLAALGENRPEDPAVEQHLAEFHAAYAKLDNDPATATQLDAMIAEIDLELHATQEAASTPPGMGAGIAQPGSSVVIHQADVMAELQKLGTRLDQLEEPRLHRSKLLSWTRPFVPGFVAVTSVLMVAAVVIVAVFAPIAVTSTLLTTLTAVPALAVLGMVFTMHILVRTSTSGDSDTAEAAYRTLRLFRGGIETELRHIEARERIDLRYIEARERIATAVSHSTSTSTLTLVLGRDSVKVTRNC